MEKNKNVSPKAIMAIGATSLVISFFFPVQQGSIVGTGSLFSLIGWALLIIGAMFWIANKVKK